MKEGERAAIWRRRMASASYAAPLRSSVIAFESNPIGMFHTRTSDALRGAGLQGGHVWASFVDDALELRGDTGGVLRIGPSSLERSLIGFVDAKGRRYQALIWRTGGTEPLGLEPSPGTWPAYTRSMMALAERCAAERRLERIERGSSRFEALFPAALMAPVAIAALVVGAFVITAEPWWGRMTLMVLPMVLFGFLLRRGLSRHWPTTLKDPEELRPVLPPLA
jgi:hypothetical protein